MKFEDESTEELELKRNKYIQLNNENISQM